MTDLHELIVRLRRRDEADNYQPIINPDGEAAALALSQLIERNEVLTRALRQVADWRFNGTPDKWVPTREEMQMFASTALSGGGAG